MSTIDGKRKGVGRSDAAAALLNAAAELLSEAPHLEVSLNEISQRASVNSAMIKYYFGNKEGLLLALLERDAEASMAAVKELGSKDIPAVQKLRIHTNAIMNVYYKSPHLNRLIHNLIESGTPDASRRVTEIFVEPILKLYREIVSQGVQEGAVRDVRSGLLYYAMVGAADHIFHAGYSLPVTLGVTRVDQGLKQKYAEMVTSIFVKGLAPD